jgi:lipopolysaccharide/colanic/teichoic acid biosynthesis glycosyltransferase
MTDEIDEADGIDEKAFPYLPPTEEIKNKYSRYFRHDYTPRSRPMKRAFDFFFSGVLIFVSLPVIVLLKIAYIIEGLVLQQSAGPLFYFYNGVSQGEVFKKWKFRVIKTECYDFEQFQEHQWEAYQQEWKPGARTIVEFFSVFSGGMSFVGPRPLCVTHYHRDLAQGNITRKVLKGGVLGLGHINKGTSEMGAPIYEYEYLHAHETASNLKLLLLDLRIIKAGALLVLKGGGH